MNYVDLGLNLDKLSENEKEQFKNLFNKARGIKEVWKPAKGKFYFCINGGGTYIESEWHNDNIDNYRYSIGNCFQTSDEAEFYREKLIVQTELEHFAFEHNSRTDPLIEKYVIAHIRAKTLIIFPTICELDVAQFTTEQIAKDAIKEIGEARILKYLFGIDK